MPEKTRDLMAMEVVVLESLPNRRRQVAGGRYAAGYGAMARRTQARLPSLLMPAAADCTTTRRRLPPQPLSIRAAMTTSAPHADRAELEAYLDRLGIVTRTVEHPAVFTVEESEKLDREMPGGHTKNLFLKDAKGRLFLVVAEARASIDMKSLHKTIDSARLSFGKPDLLLEVLGVTPGSVTAFAVLNDRRRQVTVVIDQTLMGFETLNCHPMVNTATTNIARDDLLKFMRATGHEPQIATLPAVPPAPSAI